MKNALNIILLLTLYMSGVSQTNLVMNPGFEDSQYKAKGTREVKKPGYLVAKWYSPLKKRSPHFYNEPLRSVAKANSGVASVGLILGGNAQKKIKNEYITGELKTPLIKGQAYCVSFSTLLHRSSRWAGSNIGVIFHHDKELISKVDDLTSLEASLYAEEGEFIINTKWQEYNGYFIASGGERFISFGSFGRGRSIEVEELGLTPYYQADGYKAKAYYQLDDVAVVAQNESVDCGCAEIPKEESEQVKVHLQPFLFALDASGSMKKNSLFDSLRSNLTDLVKDLPLGTPVSFTIFSTTSKMLFSGEVNRNTFHTVDSLLSEVQLGGGTNVYAGLDKAVKSWKVDGRDSARIVLISDGAFTVTNKLESLVRNQYENKGRTLTVFQIESKAKGTEKLEPYGAEYIQINSSELQNAIFNIYESNDYSAISCECIDTYSDTMNYHFVIDYSGSMLFNKKRAIKAVTSLYEQVPESAVISITTFRTTSEELFVGLKSTMSLTELEELLSNHKPGGGTKPSPGVRDGLLVAEKMASNRFSHVILITDLKFDILNEDGGMKSHVSKMFNKIDLSFSTISVDLTSTMDLLVSGRTQYDVTSNQLREVSKAKFEKELFGTNYSKCDYSTQAYHYNPAGDIAKAGAKKTFKFVLKELMRSGGVSVGVN